MNNVFNENLLTKNYDLGYVPTDKLSFHFKNHFGNRTICELQQQLAGLSLDIIQSGVTISSGTAAKGALIYLILCNSLNGLKRERRIVEINDADLGYAIHSAVFMFDNAALLYQYATEAAALYVDDAERESSEYAVPALAVLAKFQMMINDTSKSLIKESA